MSISAEPFLALSHSLPPWRRNHAGKPPVTLRQVPGGGRAPGHARAEPWPPSLGAGDTPVQGSHPPARPGGVALAGEVAQDGCSEEGPPHREDGNGGQPHLQLGIFKVLLGRGRLGKG